MRTFRMVAWLFWGIILGMLIPTVYGGESVNNSRSNHWAFKKLACPALPAVRDVQWLRNPIDRFVLARLESEGMAPSAEASRASLLRRVNLDLTGLPPTPEETERFLCDPRPDAYEQLVERLLGSPAYGERWARVWLDLARYADTSGYGVDERRSIWAYRDWVIDALNQNMPFDRFTIEQIAGDLLPNASEAQRIATGFHRNTMTNTENGADHEEFRYEAVLDRVNTTMTAWMGLSFNCAQCHDHKYDPFTNREYYRLFAFLNSTSDADKPDDRPTMKVVPEQHRAIYNEMQRALADAEQEVGNISKNPLEALVSWEKRAMSALEAWQVLDPLEYTSTGGSALNKLPDKSLLAEGANPTNDTFVINVEVGPIHLNKILLEILPFGPEKTLGRDEQGGFRVTSFELAVQRPDALRANAVHFESVGADADFRQSPVENLLKKSTRGWSIPAYVKRNRVRHAAWFTPKHAIDLPRGGRLVFTIRNDGGYFSASLQNFRLWGATSPSAEIPPGVPDSIMKVLKTPVPERSREQVRLLAEYCEKERPELESALGRLDSIRDAQNRFTRSFPDTSVMVELPRPRETRIHLRGAYLKTGQVVTPGTPAALHPFPADQPLNRLGLARWLVDPGNPLTARVQVNRFWEQYFGTGIVETIEEFGSQGEPPSHPELLDWLGSEFVRSGWDMKAIHRLIVTSATYRQSSRVTPELYQRDPYNRLLARGPRVRLDAEMIRDQALAVGGLLMRKIGGPSVMPPEPGGLWQTATTDSTSWVTSEKGDQFRRGLYTFWRRTMPYPMMVTFDAPSREVCQARRRRTDTPLQALNLLNDPVFVAAAQGIARRIIDHPGDRHEKAAYAFELCLARTPTASELEMVSGFFEDELARYTRDPDQTAAMVSHRLDPSPRHPKSAEFAAWTLVGNILLNLDEMINKG